jgi:hypothetical protein
MGGGLMQLVAYGAQDIYLTGNPQITFFKVVYRRHTNFSMESIQQTWNGSELTNSARITATISRNGDLVSSLFLVGSANTVNSADNPGALFVKEVELEIGGQRIDKQSGHWMELWAELTEPNSAGVCADPGNLGSGTSIHNGTKFQNMTGYGGVDVGSVPATIRMNIPLQFWFCRNPGLALPLIALQYHEVKVIMTTAASTQLTSITKNELWADYIYLDTDERRRFAQVSHEYLIEQVQEQSITGQTLDLNFNHPVKELVWTQDNGSAATECIPESIGVVGTNTWQLKLNGHDRFAARDVDYFTKVQVYKYHTGTPVISTTKSDGVPNCSDHLIGVYSFALKPEEHQPSGTCNFSRIDNAQLITTTASATYRVYAVNYNVLRIMSGMGGLAYSN